jgi:hypothetical protein
MKHACAVSVDRSPVASGARLSRAALLAAGLLATCASSAIAQAIPFTPGPNELLLARENTPSANANVAISPSFFPEEMAAITFDLPPGVNKFRLKRVGLLWSSYALTFLGSPNPTTVQDGYEFYAGGLTSGGIGPFIFSTDPVGLGDPPLNEDTGQPTAQAAFLVTQLVGADGRPPVVVRPASGQITVALRFDSTPDNTNAPSGNTFASSVCYALSGNRFNSPIFARPSSLPGATPPGWNAYPANNRTLILRLIIEPIAAPSPCNPADVADNGANAGPDGVVDNGDFQLFVAQFFSSTLQADCTGTTVPCAAADIADNGANATPDGFLDNGDFQLFVASFFTPCP